MCRVYETRVGRRTMQVLVILQVPSANNLPAPMPPTILLLCHPLLPVLPLGPAQSDEVEGEEEEGADEAA